MYLYNNVYYQFGQYKCQSTQATSNKCDKMAQEFACILGSNRYTYGVASRGQICASGRRLSRRVEVGLGRTSLRNQTISEYFANKRAHARLSASFVLVLGAFISEYNVYILRPKPSNKIRVH
jgi:hypothetical protein